MLFIVLTCFSATYICNAQEIETRDSTFNRLAAQLEICIHGESGIRKYCKESIEALKARVLENPSRENQAVFCRLAGAYLNMSGRYEKAIEVLEYGVALNAVENPENNYAINISLGATYFENGNRDKAVRQLWRAKDFEPYSSSMYYRAILNNYMGILYYSERAYEEAGLHFTLAIKQLTSLNTHTMQEFWLQNMLNNVGLINFHMRNFDKARIAYKLAKVAAAHSNNPDAVGNTFLNMGRLEKMDSNYEAALSYYRIAERYFQFNNEPQLKNRIYNLLTEIYLMLGRPKDAEEQMKKIDDSWFQTTDDVYFKLEHPRIRSLLAAQQGDTKEALKWKICYVQITDSLNKNLFRDKIRVESARLELEREKGNRKSAEQELALSKTRNRLTLLGFIALIAITIIIYLFAYQVRKKNKALVQLSKELRTKERKLQEMNKELGAANQHKNLILSTVAHDLRNLLSNVIQVSRLLHQQKKNPIETEKNMELLPFVIRSARMGLFTIQDLLEAAQPSRELKIQGTPILPKNIINEALELLGNRAREKQVRVKVHEACNTFFRGDQEKIIRCMINLIENALKFSESGKVIHVGCKDIGDFVQFFVVDRGIGIPENQINKLFKPFSKGQDGTQGESSTGLGLFIVRSIVRAHGGKIKFYSKPGKGTQFYLLFPK